MAELDTLRSLMPPTAECDISVDWDRMSESWGKEFPSDYRQFIELYGAGAIQDYLVIVDPEVKGTQPKSEFGGMLHETANAENAWAEVRKSPELAGASPDLIAWGADAGADLLCWDASSDDPREHHPRDGSGNSNGPAVTVGLSRTTAIGGRPLVSFATSFWPSVEVVASRLSTQMHPARRS